MHTPLVSQASRWAQSRYPTLNYFQKQMQKNSSLAMFSYAMRQFQGLSPGNLHSQVLLKASTFY